MKLASFAAKGIASFGRVEGDTLIDLGAALGVDDLKTALVQGLDLSCDGPRVSFDDVNFLPVIPNPSKIYCIGINYASHIAETGRETPDYPVTFVRFADSQVGQGQPMIAPAESEKYDFEGELAVVIGTAGRRIKKADALGHVAGYACFNDGSIRDWQRHTPQFTPGKNFEQSGAFGPWMTTTDDIPDPTALSLETRLNGQVVQSATIDDLVFDIPHLIEYLSTFQTLLPGDVIATGTTGGVGAFRKPPLWMKDGDTVEVEISEIGTLRNPIKAG